MICISIITRVKLRYYTSLNRVVILWIEFYEIEPDLIFNGVRFLSE